MARAITSYRDKDSAELRKLLGELRRESLNLRFQQASGQLENTSRRRVVRRDIARIHTLLSVERKSSESSGGDAEGRS